MIEWQDRQVLHPVKMRLKIEVRNFRNHGAKIRFNFGFRKLDFSPLYVFSDAKEGYRRFGFVYRLYCL